MCLYSLIHAFLKINFWKLQLICVYYIYFMFIVLFICYMIVLLNKNSIFIKFLWRNIEIESFNVFQ